MDTATVENELITQRNTDQPSGESDPGILLASASKVVAAAFVSAVGKHRHTEREAALLRR